MLWCWHKMARNHVFAPGEYYHVYARGVEKMPVFREDSDYIRFIEGLYLLNTEQRINVRDVKKELSLGLTSGDEGAIFEFERGETLVDIGAYCLMPNHFHILVREKDAEGKGVSKFMQKLMTSYTMYFNKKNDRTGAVFGSSFKTQHITGDTHLKYLFAYIHLNPKEIIGAQNLLNYEYSSYPEYLGNTRAEKNVINPSAFPEYFASSSEIEDEIAEWMNYESP